MIASQWRRTWPNRVESFLACGKDRFEPNKEGNRALEKRDSIGLSLVSCGEGSLLELGNFEEWCKGCLHSPLCLNAELFEALPAEWAVFELSAVSLLCKPFSTMPTLHYCCNTHFSSFTSFCH